MTLKILYLICFTNPPGTNELMCASETFLYAVSCVYDIVKSVIVVYYNK